jgi:hypothetical protein
MEKEKSIHSFSTLKERDKLESLETDRKIILKYILKKGGGKAEWNDVAQDTDEWRVV